MIFEKEKGEIMKRLLTAAPIKRYRLVKGMSAEKLAELTGLSRTMISNYESGKNLPTNKNLVKLAEVLEVEPKDLIG